MPRQTAAAIRAGQEAAFAALDEAVRKALDAVSASRTQLVSYQTEMEETDEKIAQLRNRRAELHGLREDQTRQHARVREEGYAKVAKLLNADQVSPSRGLTIAAELLYGRDNPALTAALREGRRYLQATDDEPFLCLGYVFLSGSIWCGGRTLGAPRIVFKGNAFCIALPVLVDGRRDVCNIPIDELARPANNGYACKTQVYAGEDDVVAGVVERLKGLSPEHHNFAAAREALASAGFTPERIATIIPQANS